jgi:hypothetical protein
MQKITQQITNMVASRFSSTHKMHNTTNPPLRHIIPHNFLDPTKVIKIFITFDHVTTPTKQFRYVWAKILQYGQRYYFQEQDFKDILSIILYLWKILLDFSHQELTSIL